MAPWVGAEHTGVRPALAHLPKLPQGSRPVPAGLPPPTLTPQPRVALMQLFIIQWIGNDNTLKSIKPGLFSLFKEMACLCYNTPQAEAD